jgi:hypothetical protein
MDQLHEEVGHAHELVIRGWWTGKLCHIALDDLCGVAQAIRECHRGALGKDVRGERFSVSKLRHDADKEESEGT